MTRKSKRIREIASKVKAGQVFTLAEAVDFLKECPPVKFNQTVDVSIKLGVDPRKSDQGVRGTVALPNGTGKTIRVLVFAKGEKVQQALEAGAEYAGFDELFEKVRNGWTDYDCVIATPDMMREVGKLGKVLGPRGLMPTPKAGTVTNDVAEAVKNVKAGQIEFKVDRSAVINVGVGKVSFSSDALLENIRALMIAVNRAKPATAKGLYLKSMYLSSTMGPGLRVDLKEFAMA